MSDIPNLEDLQPLARGLADALDCEAKSHAGDAWGNVYIASANCIRALLNALTRNNNGEICNQHQRQYGAKPRGD